MSARLGRTAERTCWLQRATRSQLSIPRAESRSISPRARLATFGRCVTPSGRPGSRMQRLAAATTRTAGRGAPALRSAPRSRPRRVLSEPARTSRLRRPFGGCVPLTTCGSQPRASARPRRNRSGPVLRFLNRSGPVPRFLNSKSLKSCRIFLMSRFFNARN